ncbi:PhoH family protein [Parvularcula maris]|uniref:PhoH-like protein n=1 Tax=Parvularcula maris TaxID=2965077 RepID=A0A9X2RGD6_9PROT|nr:PhoH family protein [Parvularcula maris]MCQ8183854.1 PhoH family protein [Parvularcula maris]
MTDSETLLFDDAKLVRDLCGPTDSHLVLIENALGVRIDARSNEITLTGGEHARTQARAVMEQLYIRLENGKPVNRADVEGLLRIENSPAPRKAKEMVRDQTLVLPRRTIAPRSTAQGQFLKQLAGDELVFGVGPAGTGKTYLAVANAASMLVSGQVERVILSRPAVEAGERIGFLPGDMKEKVDPYLRPLYDALYDVLHADFVDRKIAAGEIEIAPLAFMRGRTLSRAAIILDEAQNATIAQMKMFLTRFGENSRMAITGDPSQTDLLDARQSGLADALSLLTEIEGVAVTRFTGDDVVRHRLVGEIVRAYDARDTLRVPGA